MGANYLTQRKPHGSQLDSDAMYSRQRQGRLKSLLPQITINNGMGSSEAGLVGGEKEFPEEIEEVARRYGAVADVPDERWATRCRR